MVFSGRFIPLGAAILVAPFCVLFTSFFSFVDDNTLSRLSNSELSTLEFLLSDQFFTVDTVKIFINMVVLYPVFEEIIFRGFIQKELGRFPSLHKTFVYLSPANILTSTLFCLVHFFTWQSNVSLLVFFPSLIFGYLYEKYERLSIPIFIHGFYNLNWLMLT